MQLHAPCLPADILSQPPSLPSAMREVEVRFGPVGEPCGSWPIMNNGIDRPVEDWAAWRSDEIGLMTRHFHGWN